MKQRKKISMVFLLMLLVLTLAFPVTASAAKVKLNKTSISLNVKKSYTLKVAGTTKKVSWSSSNKKIATVSSKGVVKGIKKGSCKVYAKIGKQKYTCKVTVKQPVTSVKLNKKSASLKGKGKTVTLKATVSPSSANNKKVKWTTSNSAVATVSSKGVVKSVGNGTCKITVTAVDGSKKAATCVVTVTGCAQAQPSVSSLINQIVGNWKLCESDAYDHNSNRPKTVKNVIIKKNGICVIDGKQYTLKFNSSTSTFVTFEAYSGNTKKYILWFRNKGNAFFTNHAELALDSVKNSSYDYFYNSDDYMKINLNADNWSIYFDVIDKEYWDFDSFGDLKDCSRYKIIAPKKQYANKINANLSKKAAFKVNYTMANYKITSINVANRTYVLGSSNGTRKNTDSIELVGGTIRGIYTMNKLGYEYQAYALKYDSYISGMNFCNYYTEFNVVDATGTIYIHK